MSTGVMVWWKTLGCIGVINLCLWAIVAAGANARVSGAAGASVVGGRHRARRWQLLLSGLFVFGCAFRSMFPRAEAQRICLYNSWISAAVIGRSVATVAELAFVAQWTLWLREYARAAKSRFAAALSLFPLPLIAAAELFSWYTALTTNFIGSVVEESLWAVTSTLVTLGFAALWRRYRGVQRRFIAASIALNAAYFVFMCTVDVPMYWSRWRTDQANGRQYLSCSDGWRDATYRRVVTGRWDDWRDEMPWMSLYFSAGVWMSIGLVRAPRPADQSAAARARG
jgi:hypothetical protein